MREKKELNVLVGGNIQHARELAGYTQEELSELLGVTPNHLSAIERGVSGVSLETLQKLCRLLGTSADLLLFGEDACDDEAYALARQLYSTDPRQLRHIRKAITALLALAHDDSFFV